MKIATLSFVFTVLALQAQACVAPVQECTLPDGRVAQLSADRETAVAFFEYPAWGQSGPTYFTVVECNSRQGLLLQEPEMPDDNFYDAESLLIDAIHDDEETTLSELMRRVRRLGVEVERITLPQGHCGCELPELPVPYIECPSFFD